MASGRSRRSRATQTFDNLRPVVPKWNDRRTAIAWVRGSYVHNHGEWYSSVVAAVIPPR